MAWKLSGLPREEVEDVVSCLWFKLYSQDCAKLMSFQGKNGAQFATWLVQVARNAAADCLRRKRPACVPLEGSPGERDGAWRPSELLRDPLPDPLESLLAREALRELLTAVNELPRIYRQVICARFYREWSVAQAAAAFGIDEATVYVRLARAFARLRGRLLRGASAAGRERRAGAGEDDGWKVPLEAWSALDPGLDGGLPPVGAALCRFVGLRL